MEKEMGLWIKGWTGGAKQEMACDGPTHLPAGLKLEFTWIGIWISSLSGPLFSNCYVFYV